MKKKLFLILVWALAAFLLYLCFRSIDTDKTLVELARVNLFWLALAVFFNASVFLFWTWQWKLFLPGSNVSYPRMFQVNAMMASATNMVPFPGGHTLGVLILARRSGIGHTAALSVLALDQLMEGLAKMAVLACAAFLAPIPERMKQGVLVFIGLMALFAVAMFLFAHRSKPPAELQDTASLWRKMRMYVSRWAHHLEALRNFKIFSGALVLALLIKFLEILAIWTVQKSFGLDLPFWTAVLVMGALNLTTIVPITPGNLGVYEGTVFLIYQFAGLGPESALSLALLQHLCFLLPMVGIGYGVLFIVSLFSPKTKDLSEDDLVSEET